MGQVSDSNDYCVVGKSEVIEAIEAWVKGFKGNLPEEFSERVDAYRSNLIYAVLNEISHSVPSIVNRHLSRSLEVYEREERK